MNDKQRLLQWMEENGHSYRSLAAATGDTLSSAQQMTNGDRKVNQAFKWRFALAFGFDLAKELFTDEPVEEPSSDSAPIAA